MWVSNHFGHCWPISSSLAAKGMENVHNHFRPHRHNGFSNIAVSHTNDGARIRKKNAIATIEKQRWERERTENKNGPKHATYNSACNVCNETRGDEKVNKVECGAGREGFAARWRSSEGKRFAEILLLAFGHSYGPITDIQRQTRNSQKRGESCVLFFAYSEAVPLTLVHLETHSRQVKTTTQFLAQK